VILLRRRFNRPLALVDRGDPGPPQLGFAEVLGGNARAVILCGRFRDGSEQAGT
jgi:hypothetical protein